MAVKKRGTCQITYTTLIATVAKWSWLQNRAQCCFYRALGSSPDTTECLRSTRWVHVKSIMAQSPLVGVEWKFGSLGACLDVVFVA
ncbi:hypothetical protein TNCV_2915851 [Trichonephila clavipes]|nr:hypothetical protein TNCV_2915851 [Trichonephila clavipes]